MSAEAATERRVRDYQDVLQMLDEEIDALGSVYMPHHATLAALSAARTWIDTEGPRLEAVREWAADPKVDLGTGEWDHGYRAAARDVRQKAGEAAQAEPDEFPLGVLVQSNGLRGRIIEVVEGDKPYRVRWMETGVSLHAGDELMLVDSPPQFIVGDYAKVPAGFIGRVVQVGNTNIKVSRPLSGGEPVWIEAGLAELVLNPSEEMMGKLAEALGASKVLAEGSVVVPEDSKSPRTRGRIERMSSDRGTVSFQVRWADGAVEWHEASELKPPGDWQYATVFYNGQRVKTRAGLSYGVVRTQHAPDDPERRYEVVWQGGKVTLVAEKSLVVASLEEAQAHERRVEEFRKACDEALGTIKGGIEKLKEVLLMPTSFEVGESRAKDAR